MGIMQKVYDDQQRAAVQQAYGDREIRPARRIVELAEAGELTANNERVPSFTIPETTVRSIGKDYVKRREGKARHKLAAMPAQDSVEAIRRRLIVAVDHKLASLEKQQKEGRNSAVKPEDLRQIARATREIAALPGPLGEPPSRRPPGAMIPGTRQNDGGSTRGGLAGAIIAAAQDQPSPPATEDPTLPRERINGAPPEHERETDETENDSEDPGSYVRSQMAGLSASQVRINPRPTRLS